ncbi:MAG: OmpA family protein [Polyangiaceae bacterium]
MGNTQNTKARRLARSSAAKHRPLAATAIAAFAASAGMLLTPSEANAQQRTFHLDRLEMPGSGDDGMALFRPVILPRPTVFGQFGIGYSRRPLRTGTITNDRLTLSKSSGGVVDNQLTMTATAGIHLFDRLIVALSFPFTPWQDGQNPVYGADLLSNPKGRTIVDAQGPSASDLRLDLRGVIARSENRKMAFGASAHVFLPTGSQNFGGDGSTSALLMLNAEASASIFTFVANTGVHFRPTNAINDPGATFGLGVQHEWRWAVGAFIPFKDGKYRIGATIFGQTGISSGSLTGDTFGTKRNTPMEWMAEGRMRLGPSDRMWLGLSGGTTILPGYGSPDFRTVAVLGYEIPLNPTEGVQRDPKLELREKWRKERNNVDTDGDGIPDYLDACPTEPEDHEEPDPNDGCPNPKTPPPPPAPPKDTDNDGIPDAEDACPKEPGKHSPDPTKNGCPEFISREGDSIRIFKQVHFKTGSAEIMADSFPMLQEITNLLKANASIKRIAIEGHTDNRGGAAMNKTLSQNRANSVMKWLGQHGIEAGRMEAHGYGLEKPIDTNDTDEGRAKNRRVEFKILKEE